jgi:hypothetical protein
MPCNQKSLMKEQMKREYWRIYYDEMVAKQSEMIDPGVTKHNYERIGGPKRYLEVPFGHWSSQPEFWETIVQSCDEWFSQYLLPTVAGKNHKKGETK